MSKQRFLSAGLVTLFVLASCASNPPKGKIAITTQIDFSAEPFHGTFEVSEGANVLGCERGSFVDTPTDDSILKELSCDAGERFGTFTVEFTPQEIPGPGDLNGPWSIQEATGDFSGLSGGGDFRLIYGEDDSGVETLTGDIEFSP